MKETALKLLIIPFHACVPMMRHMTFSSQMPRENILPFLFKATRRRFFQADAVHLA